MKEVRKKYERQTLLGLLSKSLITRSLSIFLCLSLILSESFVYGNTISYKSDRAIKGIENKAFTAPKAITASTAISIPEELGAIDEVFIASNKSDKAIKAIESTSLTAPKAITPSTASFTRPTIIYIQDAHDSLEAQENISKIIHHLVEHYGVQTVFEEGYEGQVPTDEYFDFIENSDVKEKTAHYFMDKLRLGGAEYAHITREKDFQLIGADNLKLHRQNIEWYQKSASVQERIQLDLERIQGKLQKISEEHFSKELKQYVKLNQRFNAQKLGFVDYLSRIVLMAHKQSIFLHNYPSLSLILKAQDDSVFLQTAKQLDIHEILEELAILEERVLEKLFLGDEHRIVYDYLQIIELLMRLSDITVTSGDYEKIRKQLRKFDTKQIATFIAEHSDETTILSRQWEDEIQFATQFYETARQRDLAVERAISGKALKAIESNALIAPTAFNADILVFGGFHKNRIKELLKQRGFNYLVVTPKMTDVSEKHQRYYQTLMSTGYHSFETPFLVSRASTPTRLYGLVHQYGKNAVRDELRAVSSAIEQLHKRGVHLNSSSLIEKEIEKSFLKTRSEMRSHHVEFSKSNMSEKDVHRQLDLLMLSVYEDLGMIRPENVFESWLGLHRQLEYVDEKSVNLDKGSDKSSVDIAYQKETQYTLTRKLKVLMTYLLENRKLIFQAEGIEDETQMPDLVRRIKETVDASVLPAMRTLRFSEEDMLNRHYAYLYPLSGDWMSMETTYFIKDPIFEMRMKSLRSYLTLREKAMRFGLLGPHLRYSNYEGDSVDFKTKNTSFGGFAQ